MAKAIILGATGLVGTALTKLLLADVYWEEVLVLVRRNFPLNHPRLRVAMVDFDHPEQWQQLVQGDVLFSALGTTLARAGSKDAQYRVDHTYQLQVAKAAATNGVAHYVLVSAANASLNAAFFYSRMKAELERDVAILPFSCISILRPGLLAGPRQEKRTGEQVAFVLLNLLHRLPGLSALEPIHDTVLAQAMNRIAKTQKEATRRYDAKELLRLGKS